DTGQWRKQPLEQMSQLLTELAQQLAWEYLTQTSLQEILVSGVEALRERIGNGLGDDQSLSEMGIEIVSLRIAGIRPTAEVEKALQMPTRESIQQEADKATFERRALAVERERAIAENELQNRIELARRQEDLIGQEGQNERKRMQEQAESMKIEALAHAQRRKLESESEAESIRLVSDAQMDFEKERVQLYKGLPAQVLIGLTVREFAGQLPDVEHLTISPEMLGPILTRLADAGTKHLEREV
ncbi:MAG TPA: band 7 protein, partial [Myxococcales bacterium]|nr:band 7 protein [Myxococcales bacterium]